jgi:hypothetical protein
MNKTERRSAIIMIVGIISFITFFALSETDWGYCAKLPCPPIPLALGIFAMIGLLSFFIGVLYMIFGPEDDSKTIPNGSEFLVDEK